MVQERAVKAVDHIEKPMVYTRHRDRPVNKLIEKTFAQDVPTNVDNIVERDNVVEIERTVPITEKEIVEVIVPQKEYIKTIEEVMQPVEFIVEKVVERLVEREKPVAVPVIQEKLVKET